MADVKRVALFTMSDTVMINLILGLKTAFEAMGIEVVTGFDYLNGHRMRALVDIVRPDFIFEVNRSRNQIVDFDDKIHHIAWLEAPYRPSGQRLDTGWGGSDMTYCFVDPAMMGVSPAQVPRWDILHFAIDTNVYFPFGTQPIWDVSTIGYLGWPLQPQEWDVTLVTGGVHTSMREIAGLVQAAGLSDLEFDTKKLKECLLAFFRERNPLYAPDDVFFQIMTVVGDRIFRAQGRGNIFKRILNITQDVKVFGAGSWSHDPQLRPYFVGPIFRPSEKASIVNLSKIVYHYGGVLMHERVMEAMACGVPPIVNRTPYDDEHFGINSQFTDGEHFVYYDDSNVEDVVGRLLADDQRRIRIGEKARARILENHTWHHRAKKIIDDFMSR